MNMDVERIQKINTLALDLMKSGLAADREEAVVQAEKVYRSRDPQEPYKSVRETMREIQADAVRGTVDPVASTSLTEDAVKDILEKNTNYLVSKIKEFQDKVTALEKEMAQLRTQMSYTRPAQEARPAATPTATMPSSAPQRGSDNSTGSHPRSGNYNPSEVSIEKFFYMGSK